MPIILKILCPLILFPFWTSFYPKDIPEKEACVRKDSISSFSKLHLGKNYSYANCSPNTGFDCSGFVYYVFKHFNIEVPRSSSQYKDFGKTISLDSCQTGDIIVFTGTDAGKRTPGHVGIILSEPGNDVMFIHSSSDKRLPGVKISNFKDSPNYKKRFIKIVRACKAY